MLKQEVPRYKSDPFLSGLFGQLDIDSDDRILVEDVVEGFLKPVFDENRSIKLVGEAALKKDFRCGNFYIGMRNEIDRLHDSDLKIAELEAKLREAALDKVKLSGQVTAANAELATLTASTAADTKALMDDVANKDGQIVVLDAELVALKVATAAEAKALKDEAANKERHMATLKAKHLHDVGVLQDEQAAETTQLRAQLAELEAKIREAALDKVNLSGQVTAAATELATLKASTAADTKALMDEVVDMDRQIAELKAKHLQAMDGVRGKQAAETAEIARRHVMIVTKLRNEIAETAEIARRQATIVNNSRTLAGYNSEDSDAHSQPPQPMPSGQDDDGQASFGPSSFTWIGREVHKAFNTPGSWLRKSTGMPEAMGAPINVRIWRGGDRSQSEATLAVTSQSITLVQLGTNSVKKWPLTAIQKYTVKGTTVTLSFSDNTHWAFEVLGRHPYGRHDNMKRSPGLR